MSDIIFAEGIKFDRPRENAPKLLKGRISIKVDDLKAFLDKHRSETGWVNLGLWQSENKGTLYLSLDTWKPKKDEGLSPEDSPF